MILAYINESFILLSAVVMAFGWRAVLKKRLVAHKRLMLLGSILAAAFFFTYVLKTVVVGDTEFNGPHSAKVPYQIFLQSHSILATVAAIMGIITLWYAFRKNFGKHRKIGPWTVSLWFVTAATGLMVFLLLYIIYVPGPTTSIWRAWIGH